MPKSKTASAPAAKKAKKATSQPTNDEIALRAYHIYLERGSTPGDPMEDWLRAERELKELSKKPRRKSKVVLIAA
jgi:Protein of unknown function (DUF2934)